MTETESWVKRSSEGVTFAVRVVPRASRTAACGLMGEGVEAVLKIAPAAPPVEGKPNAALIVFLPDKSSTLP